MKKIHGSEKEMVELACTVKHETDRAFLLDFGDIEKWIPRSLIDDYSEDNYGKIDGVIIPEWFAKKEGLI